MYVLGSSVFWIPRALVWRLDAPLVEVVCKDHTNL